MNIGLLNICLNCFRLSAKTRCRHLSGTITLKVLSEENESGYSHRVGVSMRVLLLALLSFIVISVATAQPSPGSERVAAVMAPLSFMPTGCPMSPTAAIAAFGPR